MTSIAMYTGLSGMTANARRLDVIGNNIANSNTTAFKSSRMMFADQISWTLSPGSAPLNESGGTHPTQVGLGVQIAGTQRDFTGGTIQQTGDKRDLAIDGRGLFVVDSGGARVYTRAGNFRPDANDRLTTQSGDTVLGWAADSKFQIDRGALVPLSVPVGKMGFAEATGDVRMSGNLRSDGDLALNGSSISLGATTQSGFSLIPGATRPATSPDKLENNSLLTEIADPLSTTSPLFSSSQVIQIAGVDRGNSTVPTTQFKITPTTTVGDLMNFLRGALDINSSIGANPDGKTPGLSLDPRTGTLTVNGNSGTINDLTIDPTDIRLLDASGTFVRNPFVTDKSATASGESVRTSFKVYDSLGAQVDLQVGMVLVDRGISGTTWRYELDSNDAPGASTNLSFGNVQFDNLGQLQSDPTIKVALDRSADGAATPQTVSISLNSSDGIVTALASQQSAIINYYRDGAPYGTLSSYGVEQDGTITGSFTNGMTRTLGQIPIATFSNPEGLIDDGSNYYRLGPDSGPATIVAANTAGSGKVQAGSLEQSNVDLSQEFINLISTSTGYSASSRVIRTSDELIQQLLTLGR
jgi:flagellar hook protein FlgE